MRVLTVDPGVTSGWAIWDGEKITSTGQNQQMETCSLAAGFLSGSPMCAIVCESYRITQETMRKSRQNASLEIIGTLRFLAYQRESPFILQSPADAKRFMTDAKLKALGWWQKTTNDHANDALRHLGLYLAKHEANEEVLRVGQ